MLSRESITHTHTHTAWCAVSVTDMLQMGHFIPTEYKIKRSGAVQKGLEWKQHVEKCSINSPQFISHLKQHAQRLPNWTQPKPRSRSPSLCWVTLPQQNPGIELSGSEPKFPGRRRKESPVSEIIFMTGFCGWSFSGLSLEVLWEWDHRVCPTLLVFLFKQPLHSVLHSCLGLDKHYKDLQNISN